VVRSEQARTGDPSKGGRSSPANPDGSPPDAIAVEARRRETRRGSRVRDSSEVKLAGTAGKGQRCAVLGGAGEDGVACETWFDDCHAMTGDGRRAVVRAGPGWAGFCRASGKTHFTVPTFFSFK
jgi:hypothetical protein